MTSRLAVALATAAALSLACGSKSDSQGNAPKASTPAGALKTIVFAIEHEDTALLQTVVWGADSPETLREITDEFFGSDRDEILACLRVAKVTHTEPDPNNPGQTRITLKGCGNKTSGRMIQDGKNWKLVKF